MLANRVYEVMENLFLNIGATFKYILLYNIGNIFRKVVSENRVYEHHKHRQEFAYSWKATFY